MKTARYLRELQWALSSADAKSAPVLIANTLRHHLANWTRRNRTAGAAFNVALRLGGAEPTTVTLRAIGGDLAILFEIFAEQAYHIPDAVLPPDEVTSIVDCGAHIGLSALYLAYRYRNARVIAIEPNPTNYALLADNTASEPRITPVQACIAAERGVSRIDVAGPSWSHRVGKRGIEVEAVTLDDIRARFGLGEIDVLKMDVEGTERDIFPRGIGNVRAVAAELHGAYTLDHFMRDMAPRRVMAEPGRDTVFAVPLPVSPSS